MFISYGRSSDVAAWLGDSPYVAVHYDAEAEELTSEVVADRAGRRRRFDGRRRPADRRRRPAPRASTEPAADPAASPVGSDLWLDEFTDERSVTTTIDVPDDISVLLATDGTAPAPTDLAIAWPLDNSTPWAGPLLAGGALVFLGGIALLVSGFVHHRRSRGPRRNLPKGPRGKLPSAPKPPTLRQSQVGSGSGRRAVGRAKRIALLPLIVIPAFALSACSADYWPSFDQAAPSTAPATETGTPTPTEEPACR